MVDNTFSDVNTDKNSRRMWIEKYRPTNIENIISSNNNLKTLKNFINSNNLPNLLFYGPPGTGKTTTALVLAKLLNKDQSQKMTLELNASDTRGIDVVRNEIKMFSETGSIFINQTNSENNEINKKTTKFIILDEADAMTNSAQFSLRRIIEKFSYNVRFCFICNYVNKIIPAIQSRCAKFRFSQLDRNCIIKRMEFIAENEKIEYDNQGIESIIKISKGDMRNCINIMQSTYYGYGKITENSVHEGAGIPKDSKIKILFKDLLKENLELCVEIIKTFKTSNSISLSDLIALLFELILRTDFPQKAKKYLVQNFAFLEYRVNKGCNEDIQIAYLAAIFSKLKVLV